MTIKKLVYISPLKWKSYSQRPHYMMRYLADTYRAEILWIDPFPARLPKISDIFRRYDVYNQHTEEYSGIEVYSHHSFPIEPLANCRRFYRKFFLRKFIDRISLFSSGEESVLGIGKPCCLAKMLLDANMFRHSFYDAMDDYPEFHTGISRDYISAMENEISSRVDEVFTSSHFLKDKFRTISQNVKLIQNGYDGSNVILGSATSNHHLTSSNEKIIGYVGTIYHWFDWELIISIATAMPSVTIKLIGPVLGRLPGELPRNVVLLPPCSNIEAAKHMRSFNVGIIPFLKNNATRAVDPIKYYEYRSLNLPVISTLFGDMQYKSHDSGVFFITNSSVDKLVAVVDSAFAYESDEESFQLRESTTWLSRFREANILDGCFE